MLTYTKRNLNFITLLITLLLIIVIHIVTIYFILDILYPIKNYNQQKNQFPIVYSKIIPINENQYYRKNAEIFQTENFLNSSKGIIQKAIYEKNTVEFNEEELQQENIFEEQRKQEDTVAEVVRTDDNQQEKEKEEPKTQREAIKTYEKSKWRVEIPRLNLNVHILEGTTSEILLKAVGHFENTSNWNGNVGLAAHNRGYNCNFFQNIKKLKEGDEIIYYTTEGKRVYKVITNKVIEETNWDYLQSTEDNRITLITCEENRKTYRRCVQAIEVSQNL